MVEFLLQPSSGKFPQEREAVQSVWPRGHPSFVLCPRGSPDSFQTRTSCSKAGHSYCPKNDCTTERSLILLRPAVLLEE